MTKKLTSQDLKNWKKEDLEVNYLSLYEASQVLIKENEELKSLNKISKKTIKRYKDKEKTGEFNQDYSAKIIQNTFVCFFCSEKLDCNMLASIFDNPNILLCNTCLKDGWEKAESIKPSTEPFKPSKEQLTKELKEYEEMGLENYLKSFKEVYLNHVKDLKNKLKEK